MPPVRVLVADDSAVSRALLVSILESDPELRVVGEAADGAEAVRLASALRPDVVTMDSRMPVLDGLEATRRIMQESPRPIVMVSASLDPLDVERTFGAIEAGAVALVVKPAGPGSPRFAGEATELVRIVKLMAEVKVVSRSRRRTPARAAAAAPAPRDVGLVAVAASTGGPAALAEILRDLPAEVSTPIVVAQHIPPGFDQGLADWLDSLTRLRVKVGEHGDLLEAGTVVLAPSEAHLGVSREGRAVLKRGKPVAGHRPSASYLFRSVARAYGPRAVGVVLTGMGRDGADGLLELRQAGGLVLGQDEESSVVFGMPGEAAALGAVDHVLSLAELARTLQRLLTKQRAGS